MNVGQSAEISRTFSEQDIEEYKEISGHSPEARAVPEPLITSLFSYLLGVKLPGKGTNYLKQESVFKDTASVGQELVAKVEIVRLRPEKHLVDLKTRCRTNAGVSICEGRALVYVLDVQ